MISVKNISKKFGKLQVLKDFNLEFKLGNSYALMGPNGSGKTTMIKTILGMVIPDSGEILVKSQSIMGSHSYRQDIGYMPQIGRYPSKDRAAFFHDERYAARDQKLRFGIG